MHSARLEPHVGPGFMATVAAQGLDCRGAVEAQSPPSHVTGAELLARLWKDGGEWTTCTLGSSRLGDSVLEWTL